MGPYKVTMAKQTSGMTKPTFMMERSAILLIKGVAMAPSTMDMTIKKLKVPD